MSDIDESGGRETVRQIAAENGRAAFFRADVGGESDVRALFAFAESTYGSADILVNNAGPYYPEPMSNWLTTMQGNLLGTMYTTLCAVESMIPRGPGAIVNFGSTSALGHGRDHSPSPAYDAAKAGLTRLTTTLAWLKEKHGIRVNCIVPHWVATDEVATFVAGLTLGQRVQYKVPDILLSTDEIADAVRQLNHRRTARGPGDDLPWRRAALFDSGRRSGLCRVGKTLTGSCRRQRLSVRSRGDCQHLHARDMKQ
jgi:NAD(P)-dependent dehydrogenase (short-subunit alcohol dehydrogenase family)